MHRARGPGRRTLRIALVDIAIHFAVGLVNEAPSEGEPCRRLVARRSSLNGADHLAIVRVKCRVCRTKADTIGVKEPCDGLICYCHFCCAEADLQSLLRRLNLLSLRREERLLLLHCDQGILLSFLFALAVCFLSQPIACTLDFLWTEQALVAEMVNHPNGARAREVLPTEHAIGLELLSTHRLVLQIVHELEQIFRPLDAGRAQFCEPFLQIMRTARQPLINPLLIAQLQLAFCAGHHHAAPSTRDDVDSWIWI